LKRIADGQKIAAEAHRKEEEAARLVDQEARSSVQQGEDELKKLQAPVLNEIRAMTESD
jgi:hypothetical protein